MKAIAQDHYASQDVLQLLDINKPVVGKDDVLICGHAAGFHINDRPVMTGLSLMLRIAGFGGVALKIRVCCMNVARTVWGAIEQ